MPVFWCYIWVHIFSHVHTHIHTDWSLITCVPVLLSVEDSNDPSLFLFELNEWLIRWNGNINPTRTLPLQICLRNLREALTEILIWHISRLAVIKINWSTSGNCRETKLTAFAEERPSVFPHGSARVCTHLLWQRSRAGIFQHQRPPTTAFVTIVPAIFNWHGAITTQWANTGEAVAADFRKLCP